MLNCNQLITTKVRREDFGEVDKEEEMVKEVKERLEKEEEKFQYLVYLADERGMAYSLDVNPYLAKVSKAPRNQMKRHNYYPFRTTFASSNGIFFSMNEMRT